MISWISCFVPSYPARLSQFSVELTAVTLAEAFLLSNCFSVSSATAPVHGLLTMYPTIPPMIICTIGRVISTLQIIFIATYTAMAAIIRMRKLIASFTSTLRVFTSLSLMKTRYATIPRARNRPRMIRKF